jgi:hypothetical protein
LSERNILVAQGNLATSYGKLRRNEDATRMQRDVYLKASKLFGEEHKETVREANNLAQLLLGMQRYAEAKSLLRRRVPVARRVRGENDEITLSMRWMYAVALFRDDDATLGDLREAVMKLEDTGRTARRVLGAAHPTAAGIEGSLRHARSALRACEALLANG